MRNTSTPAQATDSINGAVSASSSLKTPGIVFAYGLIGWTLFVWVGRIRNILGDTELAGWSQLWRACLAISFVALALIAAGLVARSVRSKTEAKRVVSIRLAKKGVGVLALYGIVVWAVRGTGIFFGSHEVAFIVVHTVLAVVTITLGVGTIQGFVRAESATTSE